ncbi:MAG: class I SAM-dependent methyltransferase [Motiliproteus sp.]
MSMLKDFLKRLLGPAFYRLHDRAYGKKLELKFWSKWVESQGLAWKGDYAKRLDPNTKVAGHHKEILDKYFCPDMKILDVGSGPITGVGYCYDGNVLNITACDPNAVEYNDMLQEKNIVPPVVTVFAHGESLSDEIEGEFEWINCNNALDHAGRPDKVLIEMRKLLKTGGVVSLYHEINEGVREGYRGYHKWNIKPSGVDGFCIWSPKENMEYRGDFMGLNISVREQSEHVLIIMEDI